MRGWWRNRWWLAALPLLGCWTRPDPDGLTEAEWSVLRSMVLPPVPADSRLPDAVLGQRLFFDRGLAGGDGGVTVACSDCHGPQHHFSDGREARNVSHGLGWTGRNAPALLDLELASTYGWDGRHPTLGEQCLVAYRSAATMAGDADHLAARLLGTPRYRLEFEGLFGATPDAGDRLLQNVASTWAAYLLQLRSGPSPFDHFVLGDAGALTGSERRGLKLFITRAGCIECHRGPAFSDGLLHWVGIGQTGPNVPAVDLGADGGFRTRTLRNVGVTGPYFHAGQLATLEEVVRFYDRGGDREGAGPPSVFLVPLGLSDDEEADLVAFLRALTSPLPWASLLCDSSESLDGLPREGGCP